MTKVNLNPSLHERVVKAATKAGYSSVAEFVANAIETELKRIEEQAAEEQVTEQLRGLGYIE